MAKKWGLLLIVSLFIACLPDSSDRIHIVESQIRNILELPTYEHIYREIIYIGEEKKTLGIQLSDKQVLFSIDVSVTAGLDLHEGLHITYDTGKRTVFVEIPPARILSVDAKEDTINEIFVRERRTRISHLDFYDEIALSKEQIISDSINKDILGKAQNNARNIIQSILLGAGFTRIDFSFSENRDMPSFPGKGGDGTEKNGPETGNG